MDRPSGDELVDRGAEPLAALLRAAGQRPAAALDRLADGQRLRPTGQRARRPLHRGDHDPRGIANSSREDTSEDVTPAQQADDVHRLLSALGGGPADVLGSSGGALLGLALVTAHPDQLRTLVAHEPPLVELLADAARLRAEIQNIYDTYRSEQFGRVLDQVLTERT